MHGDNQSVKRPVTVVVLLALALGGTAWRLADTKPDPNTQAIADGCQRDTTKIYTGAAPNWVYVNDRDFPSAGPPPSPRWVNGVVKGPLGLLASRVASSDDPITHHSYDVNLDVTVAARRRLPDGNLAGYDARAGHAAPGARIELVPGVGAAAGRRPRRGARLVDLGLRPLPGSRRENGVPSVPCGLGRAPRRVTALAARRRRGRPLHLERPDARRASRPSARTGTRARDQFKSCSHSARDWWSVNGGVSLHALRPRPAPEGKRTSRSRSSTRAAARRSVRW